MPFKVIRLQFSSQPGKPRPERAEAFQTLDHQADTTIYGHMGFTSATSSQSTPTWLEDASLVHAA